MQSLNGGTDQAGPDVRGALAGERVRQGRTLENETGGGHDAASAKTARGFTGAMSADRTMPPEISSMRAATRIEGPLWRNRSFRTPNKELPPMRSAISVSVSASRRIQSLSSMAGLPSAGGGGECGAAATLPTLGDALAVLCVDLIAVLPAKDRPAVRERLANRLDDQASTPGAGPAAALLGAIANALMRMER